MFELYNTPHSTCSQKVRLCLAEKNVSWTDVHVDIANNEHLTPEYLTINPNGVVPTLSHNGNFICDSSVICEYLDEVIPEPALIPKNPIKRAEMRTWMRFIEEVHTVAVRVPSFNMAFAPAPISSAGWAINITVPLQLLRLEAKYLATVTRLDM